MFDVSQSCLSINKHWPPVNHILTLYDPHKLNLYRSNGPQSELGESLIVGKMSTWLNLFCLCVQVLLCIYPEPSL